MTGRELGRKTDMMLLNYAYDSFELSMNDCLVRDQKLLEGRLRQRCIWPFMGIPPASLRGSLLRGRCLPNHHGMIDDLNSFSVAEHEM